MRKARPKLGVLCGARTRYGPESPFLRIFRDHYDILKHFDFCATGGTAQSIADVGLYPPEQIEFLKSGSRGGVVQLAARVAKAEIAAVLFLTDPRDLWADVSENRALKRVCIEKEVHHITTRAGADDWAAHGAHNVLNEPAASRSNLWPPKNWKEGIVNFEHGLYKELGPTETTLALISHDEMKSKMVSFVNAHVDQLSVFHRILATGTTGWLLKLIHTTIRNQGQVQEQAQQEVPQGRFSKLLSQVVNLPDSQRNEEFADKIIPLSSGPKGGDVLIANEILNHQCHKVVFFYDPDTAHPHETDIRLLERTAQLENVYAFCISDPHSAEHWVRDLRRRVEL